MQGVPEDIIQYKRERKLYKEHLNRIHEAQPMIDSAAPSSLGLKHLETRPKKKQLIEDRQQTIAKQNKHLMAKMTMIMSEDRRQDNRVKQNSLNQRERKGQIEKINRQNRVMLERLQHVAPVLNKKKFDEDYELHKKMTSYLKKKRYGVASVKDSPSKSKSAPDGKASTFDAESYMSLFGGGNDSFYDSTSLKSPVHSMAEFRKQIISSKRMGNSESRETLPPLTQTQSTPNMKREIRFEMTHEPS